MTVGISDCVVGARRFSCETGKVMVGRLARLTVAGAAVPETCLQAVPYVVADVAASGTQCDCVPLAGSANARCELTGTCEAGDWLVSAGDGRVAKGEEGCAAYLVGIAEETGADGQLVLLRPLAGQPPGLGGRVQHPTTGKWHRVVGVINEGGGLTLEIESEGI